MFGDAVLTCSEFGMNEYSKVRGKIGLGVMIVPLISGGALVSSTQLSWGSRANSRSFQSESDISRMAVSRSTGVGYLDLKTVAPTTAWLYYYPLVIVIWMFLTFGELVSPVLVCSS